MSVACGAVPSRQGYRPCAGAGVACRRERRGWRRRRTVGDARLLDAGDGGAAVPRRAHRGAGAVMWRRAGAGPVAGFFLAAALVGLVGWALPGPWKSTIVPGLVAFFHLWVGATAMEFGFVPSRPALAGAGGTGDARRGRAY